MPTRLSNPRDLFLHLLGEALYVERRLVGEVLPQLVRDVQDGELKAALERHLDETRAHVDRAETTFRAAGATPSAGYSDSFEGAVKHHQETAAKIVLPQQRDLFHAIAAAQTEHWEIAVYRALRTFGREGGFDVDPLAQPLDEEERALEELETAIRRLSRQSA